MKPLWRAGVFSPWIHGPPPSPIQKGLLFKAGPGMVQGLGSVPILAQDVFASRLANWAPPSSPVHGYGRGICSSNSSQSPDFGQGRLARFSAKKYGLPISGQAWGAILPPGRQSCWSARSR